uniref:Disease resistance protein RGA2-like n=1 Tax=Rhizophora mucronata TaxID=61149 RepID=A0A2P2NAY7_RHIMU
MALHLAYFIAIIVFWLWCQKCRQTFCVKHRYWTLLIVPVSAYKTVK